MAGERTLQSISNILLDSDGIIESREMEMDTRAFVETMKNKNTVRKTKADVERTKAWFRHVGENRELFEIPPKELNTLLAKMFMHLKKRDGKDYEPDTVRSILASIHRHLQDFDFGGNIMKDAVFKHTRDVVASKRRLLKENMLGNKKNRSHPFTDEEITLLRKRKLLGGDNPKALTNAMWYNNTIHFGLRGRQKHTTMLWGDIELQTTSSGEEFLAFTERLTKTRNGTSTDVRAFVPKIFAQPGDENCPVSLYKMYAEKRPLKMRTPDSRFYVAVNPNYGNGLLNGNSWFMNAYMGKNKLGQIGKTMSEEGGLTGRHTNHSGRKTCITELLNNNIAPTEVAQLSGHKNPNILSLNQYNTVCIEKQQHMSNILHTSTESHIIDEVSYTELVIASQETETTLQTIDTYERIGRGDQEFRLYLPITHTEEESLGIPKNIVPSQMFVRCTFNAPIDIVMK